MYKFKYSRVWSTGFTSDVLPVLTVKTFVLHCLLNFFVNKVIFILEIQK